MELQDYINIGNVFGTALFYNIFANSVRKLIEYEEQANEQNTDDYKLPNILTDSNINNEKRVEILNNLLDIKLLNRSYILYFIFKKQGIFYASINGQIPEAFNAYEEYLFWKNIYGADNFNLDETQDINLYLSINDNAKYETCDAHINFLSWVYYSGLYDYLLSNNDIKKYILDEMYNKKLLTGNIFIMYLLFTSIYDSEYNITNNDNDNDNNDNDNDNDDNDNDNDNNDNDNNDNDNDNDDAEYTDDINGTTSDIADDNKSEDNESGESYTSENEKEINKFRNIFDMDEIDTYIFLNNLSKSTMEISCRMYNNIRNTVSEELRELMRPPID
jgi:hypothetical protein